MQCKAIASKARLGILGWILAGSVMAAELKFDNGFERGDLSGFKCSGNCPAVETNLPAGGSYSANFDLTRSMATPYRTEVTVPGEAGRFQWGTENWVGLSFRFEDWADDKDMEIAPFQIHPTPADWSDSKPESQISTGPVMMAVQAGEVRVYTYGGKIAWRSPWQKGSGCG